MLWIWSSYKLCRMLGMSCVLTCCTDKVPCTAVYLCSCMKLSCQLEFIYQTWYPSGKSKWQLYVRYSKSWTVCTNPTRIMRKSCAFWLPKVFLSAGPFRTVITSCCKFHPSAFSSRLLKADAWTQLLLHACYIMHLVNSSIFRSLADQMSLPRWVPAACDHPAVLWRVSFGGLGCVE